jgi:hypothetical protein
MSIPRPSGFTDKTGNRTAGGHHEIASKAARTLGPYLAIELLLPGGSLLALMLWLYRNPPRMNIETPREAVAAPMIFSAYAGSTHEICA